MLCSTCSKLAILYTNKTCIKCQGSVHQNICVLCESCSKTSKTCAACLKKVYSVFDHPKMSGCKGCGKK